jgi:hypothetical protein
MYVYPFDRQSEVAKNPFRKLAPTSHIDLFQLRVECHQLFRRACLVCGQTHDRRHCDRSPGVGPFVLQNPIQESQVHVIALHLG